MFSKSYLDFAVGAPFGTGSGTVYIYNAVGGDELIRQTQVSLISYLYIILSLQPNTKTKQFNTFCILYYRPLIFLLQYPS